MLYGASHNRLKEILENYVDEDDKEEKLYYVKKMLQPIIDNAKKINEDCNKNGYIKTPWGSIIHPDKEYAAYNNLVQTIASEIIVDKMFEIKKLLKDKESQFLFQIHDSLIFDVSPKEKGLVFEILEILSVFKNINFNITYRFGENYMDFSDKKLYSSKKNLTR
jgi:DNA polymerase I-like protein with 3'-5' exonuclease and polymerase domains